MTTITILMLTAWLSGTQAPAAPTAIALTNATVIDGTGAPPVTGMTVILRDGRIDSLGRIDRAARWFQHH